MTESDVVAATCLPTDDYMVQFLVENSLGALWAEMHPHSGLPQKWTYFLSGLSRTARKARPVSEITVLDPACGGGRFLAYAFDLLWDMYQEEGAVTDPAEICRLILERNLHGVDLDACSVELAARTLCLKARERAPEFQPRATQLAAFGAPPPRTADGGDAGTDPRDEIQAHAPRASDNESELAAGIGSLLVLDQDSSGPMARPTTRSRSDGTLDDSRGDANSTSDAIDLLSRRYDVVATHPPFLDAHSLEPRFESYLGRHYPRTRRNLAVAFIQRSLQLARADGRVAMVTPQAWMLIRSYGAFRSVVLREHTVECVAYLGPDAFEGVAAEQPNVALFVIRRSPPTPRHQVWSARLLGPRTAGDKRALLRYLARALDAEPVSMFQQSDLQRQGRFAIPTLKKTRSRSRG